LVLTGYSLGTQGILHESDRCLTSSCCERVTQCRAEYYTTRGVGLCGVGIYGYSTELIRYSQGPSYPAKYRSQRISTARVPRALRLLLGRTAGTRTARLGVCAAPTPAPTNVGDTNPPTRGPTLSPTRAPTLLPTFPGGARHAFDAAEASDWHRPVAIVPRVQYSRVAKERCACHAKSSTPDPRRALPL
jgi:hypothetical protein